VATIGKNRISFASLRSINLTKQQSAPGNERSALYRVPEAARLLSISAPTLKLWIRRGTVHSIKTPGGHHRIPQGEIDRLAERQSPSAGARRARSLEAISGRNKLLGKVSSLKFGGLLAQVTIAVGDQSLTAIITRDACKALGLKVGMRAYGLIKATEVMVIRA
jgi:molybdopterin-binding protein